MNWTALQDNWKRKLVGSRTSALSWGDNSTQHLGRVPAPTASAVIGTQRIRGEFAMLLDSFGQVAMR